MAERQKPLTLRETQTHVLKEYPDNFADLILGSRTFEIRQDDRDFQPGDFVVIREFLPVGDEGQYTGRQVQRQIQRIYNRPQLPGLQLGFCAMQLSSGFYS